MKSKILSFVISFIMAIFITILTIFLIAKVTIFNKDYIKNTLDNNNYYESIYESTINDMQDYMASSGLPESILDNVFTVNDIKRDVLNYLDNFYDGHIKDYDSTLISYGLNKNITAYLNTHDVTVSSDDAIVGFIKDMISIYENKVYLYSNLNNYADNFVYLNNIINTLIIVLIITLVICVIVSFIVKTKYWMSSIISSGLMLFFIRYVLYNRIGFNNIIVISNEFSSVLRSILSYIANLIVIIAFILVILGLISTIVIAIIRNKRIIKELDDGRD